MSQGWNQSNLRHKWHTADIEAPQAGVQTQGGRDRVSPFVPYVVVCGKEKRVVVRAMLRVGIRRERAESHQYNKILKRNNLPYVAQPKISVKINPLLPVKYFGFLFALLFVWHKMFTIWDTVWTTIIWVYMRHAIFLPNTITFYQISSME